MKTAFIFQKLKDRSWRYVKDIFYDQRVTDIAVIQNLNIQAKPHQKKAVICYLTAYFLRDWETVISNRTQPHEIMAIIRILSKRGYIIDLVNNNDVSSLRYISHKTYDLIFGFGESFYELTQLNPQALSVLYMTENHPAFSHEQEQKRVTYYYKRHKKRISSNRSNKFYKKHHLEKLYSEIIVMGDITPFEKQYKTPYTIFPTGLLNPYYKYIAKEHEVSRRNFLWLGSPGAAVHKGLDLLLDIFSSRDDIILHIGGISESDRKILKIPNKKNIRDYGFIPINSPLFLELLQQCTYIILPSCSEACATSVTTGMLHGLIPVVMRDSGFDRLGDHAIFLDDYHLKYLNEQLSILANIEPGELEVKSLGAYNFAHQNFTLPNFERCLSDIFNKIIATHDKSCSFTNASAIIR